MEPNLREISQTELIWYYLSLSGGCIGTLLTLSILIHFLNQYYNIFKCKSRNTKQKQLKQFHFDAVNKKRKKQIVSFLTILYFVTCLLTCSMYICVASNLITRTKWNHFSSLRCLFGYLIPISMLTISKTFLYSLFIYRIQIIFSETCNFYQYNTLYFYILYSLNISLIIILHIALLLLAITNKQNNNWSLYHSNNLIYCSIDFDNHIYHTNESTNIGITILFSLCAVLQLFISICLLFMYLKGLTKINHALLQQYIHDEVELHRAQLDDHKARKHHHIHSNSTSLIDDGDHDEKQETNILELMKKQSLEMVVRRHSESAKESNSDLLGLKRVVKMHNLIKKQSILVSISVVSSVLTWIMYIVMNKVWLLICWDVILSSICVWLTKSFSNKYWQFVKTYLCCKLCYFNDINDLLQNQ
eukprot:452842_1